MQNTKKQNNTIIFFAVLFIHTLFFVSCEGTQTAVLPDKKTTIKNATEVCAIKLSWVQTVEEENTNAPNSALQSIQKTKQLMEGVIIGDFVALVEENVAETSSFVYPSIRGFGSLDTEEIPITLLEQIKKFISSIETADFSTVHVAHKKEYLGALAKYRLENCRPIKKSYIGKPLESTTTSFAIPVFLQTAKNNYKLILYYIQSDDKKYVLDTFNVYTIIGIEK
ncbi:MAG TPA: hypothetical protein VFC68_01005, partial [Treponemataceae bacterium]|nr:hypothetical protein [Treponemataceae bacterium]